MSVHSTSEAASRFESLVDECQRGGPQFIARDGKEIAVLVSAADWLLVNGRPRSRLKELLAADWARTDTLVPARRAGSQTRSRHPTR